MQQIEEIEDQINKLKISIRGKIKNFDRQHSDKNDFDTVNKNIIKLWSQKNELIDKIESNIKTGENEIKNSVIKVNAYLNNKLENENFFKEFSKFVNELTKIHDLLEKCVQYDREKYFNKLVFSLLDSNKMIEKLKENLENKYCFFNNKMHEILVKEMNFVLSKMKIDQTNLFDKIYYDLNHTWNHSFEIKKENVENKIILTFNCKLKNNLNNTAEYFDALEILNLSDKLLKTLGEKLIENIVHPMLNSDNNIRDCTIISGDKNVYLEIILIENNGIKSGENILNGIESILKFLNSIFITNDKICIKFSDTIEEIFSLLKNKGLHQFLPSKEFGLPNYQLLLKKAEILQKEAIELNLLEKEKSINFSSDLNVNFGTKVCLDYLLEARNLCTKSLYPIIETGSNNFESINNQNLEFNQSLYTFPKCKVSENIIALYKLLEEIVSEMVNKKVEFSNDLFLTARKVCEIYVDVSPIKHQNHIKNIPQQAAIFHNNCFYLAHKLQLLIFNFTNSITFNNTLCLDDQTKKNEINQEESEDISGWDDIDCLDDLQLLDKTDFEPDNEIIREKNENLVKKKLFIYFVDFVPLLRDLGSEGLLAQMKTHEQFLLEIIESADVQNSFVDTTGLDLEKPIEENSLSVAVERMLFIVFSLEDIYKEVLPYLVYTQLMATMINAVIKNVISIIFNMKDIAEIQCNIILFNIKTIFEKIEKCFDCRFRHLISEWNKLIEIKFVLTANLQQILDRWEDGNGILASAISAENLKHLVRAVFQNTERRSQALLKIK